MRLILLTLSICFLFACGRNTETGTQPDKTKEDTASVDEQEKTIEIDSNALKLQYPNFKILYTLNGGNNELLVDSSVSEDRILTTYRTMPKNPGPNDKPYVWFEVFHFKNDSLATEYYNGLKTQEMVTGFGIDKRPKNLYLIGDIVLFHHMEHSYGHHYPEYIRNFNSVMKLDKSAKNLDSIVGFTYCSCRHEKADLSPLYGKWTARFSGYVSKDYSSFNPDDSALFQTKRLMSIRISKDSFFIDDVHSGMPYPTTSMELPDSYHYMQFKYLKSHRDPAPKDSLPRYFHLPFINDLHLIQRKKIPLVEYHFNLDIREYPTIFQLSDKSTYLIVRNRFYHLLRK